MDYKVHESAIVDEGAQIGSGSRVWHFVHVCGGARVGRDARQRQRRHRPELSTHELAQLPASEPSRARPSRAQVAADPGRSAPIRCLMTY